jgi:cytochrome c
LQLDSTVLTLKRLFFSVAESRPGMRHVLQGMKHFTPTVVALLGSTLCALALAQGAPAREWVSPPPGNAQTGAALYQQHCTACHAIDSNKIGPAHRGVVGRRVGSLPGYKYSAELAASRLRWTPQTLNKWLGDPEDLVNGQRMGFLIESEQERADLIAYLATLK